MPSLRTLPKYHSRFLTIGPPTPTLKSHSLSSSPGHAEARRRERVGVVAADHAVVDAGRVERPLDRVAAGLRHDGHRRAADFGFAETARRREGDLLRVDDVGDVARDAAAVDRRPGADAVHLQAALVLAPALAAEHLHAGGHLHVARARREAGLRRQRGNQLHDGAVAARRRQDVEHVAADRRLASDALHVHDRRFRRHGDRLLERADPKLRVHRGGRHAGELDAFPPDGAESGELEGDDVGAGPQIDDPVLAGAVGRRDADLLDQHVARDFNGDAGQHRAGGVSHHAGDRGLRASDGRDAEHTNEQEEDLHGAHTLSFGS